MQAQAHAIASKPKNFNQVLALLVRAIFFHGVEFTLAPAPVVTFLTDKCRQVSPRVLILSSRGGIIPERPEEAYLDYVQWLFGGDRPIVIAPSSLPDRETELNTGRLVLDEPGLLEEHQAAIVAAGVTAYITSLEQHQIALRVGADSYGTPQDTLSVIERAGNKLTMGDEFQSLGLEPHELIIASNDRTAVINAANSEIARRGHVILRSAVLDGGMGVIKVSRGEDVAAKVTKQTGILEDAFYANSVLVERFHNIVGRPAGLGYIEPDGTFHEVQIHDQIAGSNGEAVGILRHHDEETLFHNRYGENGHWILAALRGSMQKIAAWLAECGFVGFFSLDVILCDEDGALTMRYSEINPRCTAANVGLMLGYRLGLLESRVILTNDQVKLLSRHTFDEVRQVIQELGIEFNHERGVGVVITIPPHPEVPSFGYAVIAPTIAEAERLHGLMVERFPPPKKS